MHIAYYPPRSDISPTTEPPHTAVCLEVAVVEVHRGCEGVAGVHH
jgi:hypothetical protein